MMVTSTSEKKNISLGVEPSCGLMSQPPIDAPLVGEARVINIGCCRACRIGVMKYHFTCTGIIFAILFFPLGLLCLFGLQEQRCDHCGITLS